MGNVLTSSFVRLSESAFFNQLLPCMSMISTLPCMDSVHFKVTMLLAGLGERVKSKVSMEVMPIGGAGGVGIESIKQGALQSLQPSQIPVSQYPRT